MLVALSSVTSKIQNDGMDLVGVHEIRWESTDILESENYTYFIGKGMPILS